MHDMIEAMRKDSEKQQTRQQAAAKIAVPGTKLGGAVEEGRI